MLYDILLARSNWFAYGAHDPEVVGSNPTANSTILLKFMPKTKIFLEAPYFWQTGFQDPASISMEGILVFNKHLTFLLIVIVLFVGWFLACAVYLVVVVRKKNRKLLRSKKPGIVWLLVFLIANSFGPFL